MHMEAEMGAEIESNHANKQDLSLAPIDKQAEEFEDKLREDNMYLYRQFRIKDFMVREQNAEIQR